MLHIGTVGTVVGTVVICVGTVGTVIIESWGTTPYQRSLRSLHKLQRSLQRSLRSLQQHYMLHIGTVARTVMICVGTIGTVILESQETTPYEQSLLHESQ